MFPFTPHKYLTDAHFLGNTEHERDGNVLSIVFVSFVF